jgi:threonine aldolase
MMAAMASAPLGDSARGDDPTVNALERVGAQMTGKEAALYLPSGTMANLAALLAHEVHGGEVIVEESAHIFNSEGGGISSVAGGVPRPLKGRFGVVDPAEIGAAIRGRNELALAPTRLICLENTHNASGGCVLPLEHMAAVHALAQHAQVPVHVDGARLINAAAYLNVPMGDLCRHADSVWFALCKGLGAPVGAILAGSGEFIRKARRASKMLGGAMRQAGVIAAPAIVALASEPYAAHRRDHMLAQQLAHKLAAIDPTLVDVARVQTNIVNCMVDHYASDATEINKALRARGLLANAKQTKIRFVTHCHIDAAAVDAAASALADALRTQGRAP